MDINVVFVVVITAVYFIIAIFAVGFTVKIERVIFTNRTLADGTYKSFGFFGYGGGVRTY